MYIYVQLPNRLTDRSQYCVRHDPENRASRYPFYAVLAHSCVTLVLPATKPHSPIQPRFQPGSPPVELLKCSAMGNHALAIMASVHHLLSNLESSSSWYSATALPSACILALVARLPLSSCHSLARRRKSHDTPPSHARYAQR